MASRAVVVGAGLVGSLMACYLARAGWRVRVYERRGDPRAKGYSGGRSINLALSARGLWGLAGVGLDRVVLDRDAIPMRGRMIHPVTGDLAFQPYSADPKDAINSVSRGGLNLTLLNAAAAMDGVELFFDRPCADVDLERNAAIFETGSGFERAEADLIVGADGAFSAVRGKMQKTDRFEYSQSYLEHGYKELVIPAGAGAGTEGQMGPAFAMEPNALHIWPRGGSMMIALPNRDGSFTCTLFWPMEGGGAAPGMAVGLDSLRTAAEVESFFQREYPDAVPLMPTLAEDYLRNPNGSLVTVRCWPWRRGRTVLAGDAAHAIVPFYGQGMNCGFEDCRELAACLERHGTDIDAALEEYQSLRKPHADAIADMAVENFVEMRDKVGDPAFRYRKKVEQAIHQMFPDRWMPQYNLVSFSTVPYAEARRRGRELDAVVSRVVERVPRAQGMEDDTWRTLVRRAVEHDQAGKPAAGSGVIDITPRISSRLGVWPGDTPLSREVLCEIQKGDAVTLSTIRATVHLGAHADGPNHYGAGARDISRQPLEHYLGPCQVVEARTARGGRVRPEDLTGGIAGVRRPRVLIKTGTFPDPESWNPDFAGLSPDLVDALAARGVITVGIDTPSVDLQDSKDLPAHKAVLRTDMAILEGLALRDVPPGDYELIAPPLPLEGFDASPVRAVLRIIDR